MVGRGVGPARAAAASAIYRPCRAVPCAGAAEQGRCGEASAPILQLARQPPPCPRLSSASARTVDHAVVAGHALPQPDDLLQAQVLLEHRLDGGLAVVRVAAGVQQALLGHHQGAAGGGGRGGVGEVGDGWAAVRGRRRGRQDRARSCHPPMHPRLACPARSPLAVRVDGAALDVDRRLKHAGAGVLNQLAPGVVVDRPVGLGHEGGQAQQLRSGGRAGWAVGHTGQRWSVLTRLSGGAGGAGRHAPASKQAAGLAAAPTPHPHPSTFLSVAP